MKRKREKTRPSRPEAMQTQAARSVNIGLVVRNWLFGWYIVEYQQNGADRAEYGESVIIRLYDKLTGQLGRGFSERALEQCRKFYQTYAEIPQTASAEFQPSANKLVTGAWEISQAPSAEFNEIQQTLSGESFFQLMGAFKLSWSHYVVLLTLDDPAERSFYEIEAAANSWRMKHHDQPDPFHVAQPQLGYSDVYRQPRRLLCPAEHSAQPSQRLVRRAGVCKAVFSK